MMQEIEVGVGAMVEIRPGVTLCVVAVDGRGVLLGVQAPEGVAVQDEAGRLLGVVPRAAA